jgi:rRNA maturation endonuclease Nob1
MNDKTPHICYECDSEFFVFPTYDEDTIPEVSFCAYCGSELEAIVDEDVDELFDEDDDT